MNPIVVTCIRYIPFLRIFRDLFINSSNPRFLQTDLRCVECRATFNFKYSLVIREWCYPVKDSIIHFEGLCFAYTMYAYIYVIDFLRLISRAVCIAFILPVFQNCKNRLFFLCVISECIIFMKKSLQFFVPCENSLLIWRLL